MTRLVRNLCAARRNQKIVAQDAPTRAVAAGLFVQTRCVYGQHMSILLRVTGEVEKELLLGFADLAALPDQVADVSTVIPGREGAAVPLAVILAKAGRNTQATHITLVSGDGRFSASVPLAAVDAGLVVYRLDAEPLPANKGGPLRFLIPNVEQCAVGGIDACANVKFLAEIRLSQEAGKDTRPTTTREHEELHRHES